MRPTGNLLALAGLGRSIYVRWRSQRLLSSVIVVVGLVWITSALVSAILIGGFYAAYQSFLYYGLQPLQSVLAVGGIAIIIALALVATIRYYARKLLTRMPATNRVTETIDAFLDGLMAD